MVHQFIDCPTDGCPERIPSRLVCRGHRVPHHRGLDYQVCSSCDYFKWLEPDQLAAAERRFRDSPANGAPPFPPPEGLDDPWARSPPAVFQWLDPALAQPFTPLPSSQPPLLVPYSSQLPPPSQGSSRARCSAASCKRLAGSVHCSYGMCKPCCELQRKGCVYAGHRKQAAVHSTSTTARGDPSALARPAPMFPLHDLEPIAGSSSSANALGDLPVKTYKKTMDEEWVRRYNNNHEQREVRRAAEEERRQQQLMFDRQVKFHCWTANGEEPEFARLQGIATFPKLNMAQHPRLLKTFGLVEDGTVWLYDPDGRSFIRRRRRYLVLMMDFGLRGVLPRRVGPRSPHKRNIST
ncbi:hypothetical protein B0H19DRAFT_76750 [Mycena capillaripes]|nr:hypothetical protein B0H19DRAFT_76750 [Mycena capillaripes]